MAKARKAPSDKDLQKDTPPGMAAGGRPKREYRRTSPVRTNVRKSRARSDLLSVADSYATEALTGNVSARVREMARRYLEERRPGSGVVWDGQRLEELVEWSKQLVTARGPMQLMPWAIWVLAMFVSRRSPDGLPMTKELLLQVPRGAGKTQLAAALCGWTLARAEQDGKVRQEVIVLATMAEKAKEVADRLEELAHVKSKTWKMTGKNSNRPTVIASPAGTIKCCASTPQNADGITPALIILDEAARMDVTFNRALSSMVKVPWSQALIITTPDVDQYVNPYGWHVREVEEALDGGKPLPPGMLGVMFQADDGDDPTDPATWAKANPGLGVSAFESNYHQRKGWATGPDPTQREEFYTQYLATFVADLQAAIPIEFFDACVEPWELESMRGRPAVIGIDFSVGGYSGAQCDLTSLNVAVWDGERLNSRNWHWWAGRDMAADEVRTKMPLRAWREQGLLRSSGETINLADVREVVASIARVVDLKWIVCDPAAGQASRIQAWERDHGWMVSRSPQNVQYMGMAWAIWQEYVRARRIRFAHDPVLRGAIESSRPESGPTGLVTIRKRHDKANNDPLIACLMAIKAMQDREMLNPTAYCADSSRIVI